MSNTKTRPVLVTTKYRGVFYGHATDTTSGTIRLTGARMCVYWSPAMQGVVGLAAYGPDGSCRIGPAADAIEVRDVTAVMEVSEQAVKRWEGATW